MIELPESKTIAKQLSDVIIGKTVSEVICNHSPHKFAFFYKDDSSNYLNLMKNKQITNCNFHGGFVEIALEEVRLTFSDGVNILYLDENQEIPKKHQLLIIFNDGSKIACTVQMYGFISAFKDGENDNFYYLIAKEKPSPFSDEFSEDYFYQLISPYRVKSLSVKAFLATEQRIPGLGNGILQDILFYAKIHPKRKLNTLDENDINNLYHSIKSTIKTIADLGGRNTEKDIYGNSGGYITILSSKNNNKPCSVCNTLIKKEAYLGGSIYYCECQG